MYDFYFGERDAVLEDEVGYLISVKRMMPRWCNSIPDSELVAIHNDLERSNVADSSSQGVLVETGCGASTLVLAYGAFKYDKRLYTWDTNQNKLAYVRGILTDTLGRLFGRSVQDVWTYVPYRSDSQDLGIAVLGEFEHTVDFAFFDSEHTSEVLLSEVRGTLDFANDGAIFAIDDANYDFKYKNTAYINVFRKKLGLPPIENPSNNKTAKFFELVEQCLKETYPSSVKLEDSYKRDFKDDLFWSYYSSDRKIMDSLSMERLSELEHRYDSFRVVQ